MPILFRKVPEELTLFVEVCGYYFFCLRVLNKIKLALNRTIKTTNKMANNSV